MQSSNLTPVLNSIKAQIKQLELICDVLSQSVQPNPILAGWDNASEVRKYLHDEFGMLTIPGPIHYAEDSERGCIIIGTLVDKPERIWYLTPYDFMDSADTGYWNEQDLAHIRKHQHLMRQGFYEDEYDIAIMDAVRQFLELWDDLPRLSEESR